MFMSFSHPILFVHVDFRIFAATIVVCVVLNVGRVGLSKVTQLGTIIFMASWQYGFSRDHVDGVSTIHFGISSATSIAAS